MLHKSKCLSCGRSSVWGFEKLGLLNKNEVSVFVSLLVESYYRWCIEACAASLFRFSTCRSDGSRNTCLRYFAWLYQNKAVREFTHGWWNHVWMYVCQVNVMYIDMTKIFLLCHHRSCHLIQRLFFGWSWVRRFLTRLSSNTFLKKKFGDNWLLRATFSQSGDKIPPKRCRVLDVKW